MCGIFGFISDNAGERGNFAKAHKVLTQLAKCSETRGTHASGYAVCTAHKFYTAKSPVPGSKLFASHEWNRMSGWNVQIMIGHTRFATSGDPRDNINNHPHIAGKWAVVHNGYFHNHELDALTHEIALRSECDSEIIPRLLKKYGKYHGPLQAIALNGRQSVLALDKKAHRLVLWTDGGMPMVTFQVNGIRGVFFASTEQIAQMAVRATGIKIIVLLNIVPGYISTLSPGGRNGVRWQKVCIPKFEKKSQVNRTTNHYTGEYQTRKKKRFAISEQIPLWRNNEYRYLYDKNTGEWDYIRLGDELPSHITGEEWWVMKAESGITHGGAADEESGELYEYLLGEDWRDGYNVV